MDELKYFEGAINETNGLGMRRLIMNPRFLFEQLEDEGACYLIHIIFLITE